MICWWLYFKIVQDLLCYICNFRLTKRSFWSCTGLALAKEYESDVNKCRCAFFYGLANSRWYEICPQTNQCLPGLSGVNRDYVEVWPPLYRSIIIDRFMLRATIDDLHKSYGIVFSCKITFGFTYLPCRHATDGTPNCCYKLANFVKQKSSPRDGSESN